MNTELIYKICKYLKTTSHAPSEKVFSKTFLKRSDRYLSYLRCVNGAPQTDSLLHLAIQLRACAETTKNYSGDAQQATAKKLFDYPNLIFEGLKIPLDVSLKSQVSLVKLRAMGNL
jgi:hypothetical protein